MLSDRVDGLSEIIEKYEKIFKRLLVACTGCLITSVATIIANIISFYITK